jgi:hypothetical protein
MATHEADEFLQYLEGIVERLERVNLRKALPDMAEEAELEELKATLTLTRTALARLEEWKRHDLAERSTTAWLDRMTTSHATLLDAINANMHATNALLRTSQARLAEIEQAVILKGQSPFTASQDVLDEGAYLYRVLATGAQGTEAGGPLLKDAPRVVIEPGIEVLAHAVEEVLENQTTNGGRFGRASDEDEE